MLRIFTSKLPLNATKEPLLEHLVKKIYTTLLSVTPPTSYISLEDFQYLYHRRKFLLLKTCLYITFLTLFLFSCLHAFVFQDIGDLAFILKISVSLLALYFITSLNRNPSLENTANIATYSTLIFGIFLLVFSYLVSNQSFSLIWAFFFPIFAIMINGYKSGLRYTIVFLSILLFMAYEGIGHWQSGLWNELSFIRLSLALAILTFIVYIHEVALTNTKRQAEFTLEKLHALSAIDELTQIANRRNIDQSLFQAIQHAERYDTPLSLTLFDIDNFKKVNDQCGHLAGDTVLLKLVTEIKHIIRSTDSFGRWGGEEFLIILPNETLESAINFCEKVRVCVEKTTFAECSTQITCSFGVASFQKGMTAEQLIEKADKALYQAKHSGKNRVNSLS